MKNFRVALLQLLPTATAKGNIEKGIEYLYRAKEAGADIAVFPEMWNTGYNISADMERLRESAVSYDSEYIAVFREKARELDMAVGITFLEKNEPLPKNTFCVFDRFGKTVLKYSKVHICLFGDESRLSAGDDFYTARLDTANGSVNIGAMICYDREFPESARILMLKGAEIILVTNACPMEINRLSQLRARAFENMTGIATVNYAAGKEDCNGHSSAFDAMAYTIDSCGSRDTCLIEAGEEEGIYFADFPVDEMREYRKSEVWG